MGECREQEADGVARTKRTVAAWLLVVFGFAVVSADLVSDSSGAHLELAPVFFGVAIAVAFVRMFRSRSGRPRL
jgi:predicted cobalt transporter CbtA